MKQFFLFFSFVIAITLFSCNNKVGEVLDVQDEQTETKDSIFTYDMFFDSEIIPYDGTTRTVMASDWDDGDIVFFELYNSEGQDSAYGKAEYNGSSKKWCVTLDRSLDDFSNGKCAVRYYEFGDMFRDCYYYLKGYYETESGSYTFSNNTINVNAVLEPKGWRLRFKGTPGTVIQIYGPYFWICFQRIFDDEYFSRQWQSIDITINSSGYSDYFCGFMDETIHSINLRNKKTGEAFIRYFDVSDLKEGESGCFTIPTSSNLYGWTIIDSTINDHECVDLGLPSGTLWATCNIGASTPEEYGGYYAWGETWEKKRYSPQTYAYLDESKEEYLSLGDDIAGTIYDVAHMKWGGSWQMPSYDQIQELIDFCTTENINRNGVSGTLVTGPNGNSFFLPDAGGQWDGSPWMGSDFGYWSSTNFGSLDRCKFKAYNGVFEISPDFPPIGMPVRAVIKTTSAAYAIDLGLPSGTKWASWNVGASSSEQVGNYFAWGETSTKSSYTSSNYTYTGSSDLSGTSDAATVNWGTSWRMPTVAEAEELINCCTKGVTTINGVEGYLFTGPNDNQIFFPYTGFYEKNSKQNTWQCFYSLSDYYSDTHCYFFNGEYARPWGERYRGRPIRPVYNY